MLLIYLYLVTSIGLEGDNMDLLEYVGNLPGQLCDSV